MAEEGGGGRERDRDYLQPSLLRDPHLFLAFATVYVPRHSNAVGRGA